MGIREAQCRDCKTIFNPTGDEVVRVIDGVVMHEHYFVNNDESDGFCGGFGPIIGEWEG